MNTSRSIARVEGLSKRFVVNKDKSLRGRVLSFSAIRKNREDFWALRDVNLDVLAGTTVGLVGHNGSGKSTLLKSIGGIIEPTSGKVWRRGRLAALLELGAGFHPDLTGRENVFMNAAILGLTRRETVKHFDEMVAFSGVEDFIDTQVKFYSSGMFVRLAFAVAVHSDPDLLLVDEVLAVGDEPYQRKCIAKIAEFQRDGRSILLVSHVAEQVGQLCDRVAVLENGRLVHNGDPARGLQILRSQYEARGGGTFDSPDDGDGSGYVIRGVTTRLTEHGGEPRLIATIAVDIQKPRRSWDIEFAIDTALGIQLFVFKVSDAVVALPNTIGRHEVSLTFPQVPLGPGTYLVSVSIGGANGIVFDRIVGTAGFDVPRYQVGGGLLRLSPEVSFDVAPDE